MTTQLVRRSDAENVWDLFEDVIRAIEEEPKRLDMGEWGIQYDADCLALHDNLPACGTVGCVAGWLSFLAVGSMYFADRIARKILGAEGAFDSFREPGIYEDTGGLFYFFPTFDDASIKKGTPEYVAAVVACIREFMTKHEAYLRNRPVNRDAYPRF